MVQRPENGEEGVNTVFPRQANIERKPNRAHLCLANIAKSVLATCWRHSCGYASDNYGLQKRRDGRTFYLWQFSASECCAAKGIAHAAHFTCNKSAQSAPNPFRQQAGKVEERSGRTILHHH